MKKKATKLVKNLYASAAALSAMGAMTAVQAFAEGEGAGDFGAANITATGNENAKDLMGNVVGILLTITRYVGVALVIYGVYEIVMSFMQNQPEAKTKGIVMALSGVVMIGLKSVLQAMKIIS